MAVNNDIFDINQKHLVGRIVRSTYTSGRILDIKMPSDSSIVTVTAADLAENSVRFMNGYLPIFADDFIACLGQPVMAVFGPSMEVVESFCNGVETVVDISAVSSVFGDEPIKPFNWSSGDVSQYFVDDAKIIESEFSVTSEPVNLLSNERTMANFVDGFCHLQLSSQWPLQVKDAVAHAIGMPKSNVIIYEKNFRSDFDQLLVLPSIWAPICAAAAKKSGQLVELISSATSWQPATSFKRQTVINEDGKALAEKISVVSDFGAFPLFTEEACHNILAGLVPPYDLSAIDVTIEIQKSSTPPASFFSDLGYSTAVAYTEYHFNKIAYKLRKSPYEWKAENLSRVSLLSEKVRKCNNFDLLKQTLEECATDSWFARNYSACSQKNLIRGSVSPFVGYSRGTGIACAQGVGGFSEKYPYGGPHSISISISEDDRAFVSLGFHIPKDTVRIYKGIIEDHLGIPADKIFFIDINSEAVKDFGPNVLSRSISVVPKLLINACSLLQKRLAKGAAKPLVQQVFYHSDKEHAFFEANCFGAIAISCHIDPIKVVPVIDNVTARLRFGKVYETSILARRIRQIICSTISQLCPCADNNYTLDLKVKSNPHLPAGSCSSMLRGITGAALTSAISQALGHELHLFPVYDNDVISIVQKKRKATESVNET